MTPIPLMADSGTEAACNDTGYSINGWNGEQDRLENSKVRAGIVV